MSEVAVGSVIDSRYRITGELGKGGMGTVYRAEHVTIRRPVALKLLDPVLSRTTGAAQRFEREAFAAGRIDHPNCVTVSDFGTHDDGTLYLVMELIRGEPLGDVIERQGRMRIERALHIIRHVLRGLGHAHESGIVHRDIKPDNILLVEHAGDPDFAKILDFGIAKLLGEAETDAGGDKLTQAGFTVGTPAYLSPEQAFGEEIDSRSDLYSASVVLYEMITGKQPFRSDDKLAVLSMHVGKDVPPFSETTPELPPMDDVERVVLRGLAKKREDRYATAEEYIAAIDALARVPRVSAPMPAAAHTPMPVPAATPMPVPASATPLPSPAAVTPMPTRAATPMPTRAATPTPVPRAPSGTEPTQWAAAHTPLPGPALARPRRKKWMTIGAIVVAAFAVAALAGGLLGQRSQLYETYVQELKEGKSCDERRAAVLKLRGLGDKRAIKPLKRARYRMRGGLAGIGDKNTNGCLRKDAEEAIEYLEGL